MDVKWRMVPGFEVDDNQRTNKESSPVNTGPSKDTVRIEIILWFHLLYKQDIFLLFLSPMAGMIKLKTSG